MRGTGFTRGMTGRADLIRARCLGDPELEEYLAGLLGYRLVAPEPPRIKPLAGAIDDARPAPPRRLPPSWPATFPSGRPLSSRFVSGLRPKPKESQAPRPLPATNGRRSSQNASLSILPSCRCRRPRACSPDCAPLRPHRRSAARSTSTGSSTRGVGVGCSPRFRDRHARAGGDRSRCSWIGRAA